MTQRESSEMGSCNVEPYRPKWPFYKGWWEGVDTK